MNDYQVINTSKIKGLMAQHNESISELALSLEIHRNTLSFKLNNKRSFTISELKHISDKYNVEISYFFK